MIHKNRLCFDTGDETKRSPKLFPGDLIICGLERFLNVPINNRAIFLSQPVISPKTLKLIHAHPVWSPEHGEAVDRQEDLNIIGLILSEFGMALWLFC